MGPYGPTAILDAILNKKMPKLNFYPPTENDPGTLIMMNQVKKMFFRRQGVHPPDTLTIIKLFEYHPM